MKATHQIAYGCRQLKEMAERWDIDEQKVAVILADISQLVGFYGWVNADEFLNYRLSPQGRTLRLTLPNYMEDCSEDGSAVITWVQEAGPHPKLKCEDISAMLMPWELFRLLRGSEVQVPSGRVWKHCTYIGLEETRGEE